MLVERKEGKLERVKRENKNTGSGDRTHDLLRVKQSSYH
jgi:hypothetical protein